MNGTRDVFLHGVLHRIGVEWKRPVRLGILGYMIFHEFPLQGLLVRRGDDPGRNLLGRAVLGPDHGCPARRSGR